MSTTLVLVAKDKGIPPLDSRSSNWNRTLSTSSLRFQECGQTATSRNLTKIKFENKISNRPFEKEKQTKLDFFKLE